jgi:hypothetical protein
VLRVCFDSGPFASAGWVRPPSIYQKVENMPLDSPVLVTCVQLLVTVAVASLACIAISPSLYNYYESKSDLCVLIAVPGLCLTASIAACVPFYSSLSLTQSDLTFICRHLSLFMLKIELDQHLR